MQTAGTPAISTVTAQQSDEHEFILWNDGSLTIEHWMYQFVRSYDLDRTSLTLDQARALRAFLNSPEVSEVLDR